MHRGLPPRDGDREDEHKRCVMVIVSLRPSVKKYPAEAGQETSVWKKSVVDTPGERWQPDAVLITQRVRLALSETKEQPAAYQNVCSGKWFLPRTPRRLPSPDGFPRMWEEKPNTSQCNQVAP